MKWNYYEDYDGLTDEQVKEMSISELDMHIETNMEKNAWAVAKQVQLRIDAEKGPAGDYLKCYVTDQEDEQFFFNEPELLQYCSVTASRKPSVPRNFYLKNLFKFVDLHVEFGELYMEYRKGKCEVGGLFCYYCTKTPTVIQGPVLPVPRLPDPRRFLKTTRSSLQKMFRNPHN